MFAKSVYQLKRICLNIKNSLKKNLFHKYLSILLCCGIILPLLVIAVNAESTQVYSDPFLIFSRPYAYYYMRDESEILNCTINAEGQANQFYLQEYSKNDIRSYTEFLDPADYYNYDLYLGTKRIYQSSDNGINEQYSDFPIRYVQQGDVISFSAHLDFTRSNALQTFQPTAVYDTYTIRRADGTEYYINNYARITWKRIYLDTYDTLPYPKELLGTVKVNAVIFNYSIVIPEGGQLVDWGLHFSREENRLTREDSANNYDPNEIGNQFPPCNYLNYYFRGLDWTYTTTDDNALLNGIVNNNQLVINKVQSVGDQIDATIKAEVDKIINVDADLAVVPEQVTPEKAEDVYEAEDAILNGSIANDSMSYFAGIFSPLSNNNLRGMQALSSFINDIIISNSFFTNIFAILIPLGLSASVLGIVGLAFSRNDRIRTEDARERKYLMSQEQRKQEWNNRRRGRK